MKKGLLPIGTVVLLEGGTKKVMITGYYSKAEGENKVYQYNGCIFPEGFMENVFCLFDQHQIEEVFYKGLENEEYENYVKDLNPDNSLSFNSVAKVDDKSSSSNVTTYRRTPKAPTKPLSKSEMKARFTKSKMSGNQ
ncbi:MAG: DUF4176 domain-containing protein [Bacilli bacterium]|nr:DUF4176 domain-containing protein [Bacilli bacterium]